MIVLAGLPGSGKSSIARALAEAIGAFWLRIDSIEQAMRDSGVLPGPVNDAGYRAAYALAADNLRVGHHVIADCVNDCSSSRDAWRDAGLKAGANVVEVEVICSDPLEHRRRVEGRPADIPGLTPPTWESVQRRDYEAWDRDHTTVDTARMTLTQAVDRVLVAWRPSPKSGT